ncbi:hypothetical protein FRB95_014618 [Tulasnella sp. JGI-2019a]|nr:hypothetical protein FRB95_014618 [Tulasnella sp. JGI-2019a]
MLTFRSISASIRVDGKDLPHFQPEYDNVTNTVTCWIHSLPGKEYSIWMRKEAETAYDIAAHVHLDGSEDYATSFCLTNTSSERRRSAIPYGANKERPLVFADGVYDDQYDLSSDASSATNPNQGSIKITAQRITLINSEQSAWHPFASTHHEDYDYRRLPGNLTQ